MTLELHRPTSLLEHTRNLALLSEAELRRFAAQAAK